MVPQGYTHRGAIQEAPCTIKRVKSLMYSYRASNCFITYTVNHGIIWCDINLLIGVIPLITISDGASRSSSSVVTLYCVHTYIYVYLPNT